MDLYFKITKSQSIMKSMPRGLRVDLGKWVEGRMLKFLTTAGSIDFAFVNTNRKFKSGNQLR